MNNLTAPTRIIVGIGDDEAADTVLAYAVTETRRLGAELIAVRAWGPLADPTPRDAIPPGAEEELTGRAAKRIEDAFAAVGGVPADVEVTRRVVEGPAGQALVAAADRPDDVMVIARSRHRLVHRAVFGSVPDYVMDHATCPIIIQPVSREPSHSTHRQADATPVGIFY